MSQSSNLEEDGIPKEEYGSEPSPSSDGFYETFAACQRPCAVFVKRLTEEEILRWTRPERTQKQIAKNYLKDVPRVDFGLFDQYKRSRLKFINRRNRQRHLSAESFGFSSNEEVPMHEDDEEYVPEVSHRKKKRRLAYEDDDDWNPNDDGYSPKPKKTLRNLRVNTRRKRIESNSESSDGDFDLDDPDYTDQDIYNPDEAFEDPKPRSRSAANPDYDDDSSAEAQRASSKDSGFPSGHALDTDVVSQIMKEMEDFRSQNGSKSAKSCLEDGKRSSASVDVPRPRQKRRVSRVPKITDSLTPTIRQVQQVVRNMVNTVCSFEKVKENALEELRKRACKWCDSPFLPQKRGEQLCKICNDVERQSITPTKINKRVPKVKGVSTKTGIKNRALKGLPKYEQRRLTYTDSNPTKNVSVPQDMPVNKVTIAFAEVYPSPTSISDVTNVMKRKKPPATGSKTKVIKTKRKKPNVDGELTSLESLPDGNVSAGKSTVEDSNMKGLLKIDFPGAGSITIAPKQPASSNVQYGTYILPPTPTVVLANYAATDAKSGDYYLSSVYYQNEMTQSKATSSKNENPPVAIAAKKVNSLPSMPSMDQLSISFLDQLSNNSSLSFTTMLEDPNILPSLSGIEAKVVNSKTLSNQISNKTDYNHYSLESDLNLFLNNPNFQIQPIISSEAASDIAGLFSNSQLNVQPLASQEDISYDLMEGAQIEENNPEVFTSGEELGQQFGHIPSKSLNDVLAESEEPTANKDTDTSKPVNKDKASKQSSVTKEQEKTPEEKMSSEEVFRNMSIEIDAIAVLGIIDLDRSPRFVLENLMKKNRLTLEQLQGQTPKTKQLEMEVEKIEENWLTLQRAKQLLHTFGTFEKYTNTITYRSQILAACEIKKEKNLEQEEEQHSDCQFSQQSKPIPEFVDIMEQQGGTFSLDDIPDIESEINSMPPADLSQFGTTVHHFPAPASIPRSESRDTPSRGSGPVTPARPESAMSQHLEEPALTPIQIKKEKMEAENLGSSSQCSFTSPPPVRTPVQSNQFPYTNNQAQQQIMNNVQQQQQQLITNIQQQQMVNNVQQQTMNNLQSQQQLMQSQQPMFQPQQQMIQPQQHQQQMIQQQHQQMIQPPQQQHQQVISNVQHQQVINSQVSMSVSQNTFTILDEMTRRLQGGAPTTQTTNSPQLRNVLIAPNNQQMNSLAPSPNNQQALPKILQYQNRPPAPPNVSVANNQNFSNVLLNISTRNQMGNANVQRATFNSNSNYIFKNGQMVNIQQQNSNAQNVASANFNNNSNYIVQQQNITQNTNVVYKTTPMVNVQQVYLPSQGQQQRYQPATNQYNISVQQAPPQGQLIGNSAAQQGGYSFQGQQQLVQQQHSPVVQQQNPAVQQQIKFVPQQNPVLQPGANQNAFLMPNNRLDISPEEPMFCAMCGKPATLRCKQCAKIAYCDTKCARSYWHNVHKRECVTVSN